MKIFKRSSAPFEGQAAGGARPRKAGENFAAIGSAEKDGFNSSKFTGAATSTVPQSAFNWGEQETAQTWQSASSAS